jgi:hypothetical protein
MRISVSNWQTTMNDVRRTVGGVERALAPLVHRRRKKGTLLGLHDTL